MNNISTDNLSKELSKRPGVTTIVVKPHDEIKIQAGQGAPQIFQGPAVILINQD